MLRKRLDKKKEIRRGEGSASPQRMDYSSDTGSQNSLNLKVSSGKCSWLSMESYPRRVKCSQEKKMFSANFGIVYFYMSSGDLSDRKFVLAKIKSPAN